MANTRKRDARETPRAFTEASQANAQTGEHTESGEAWAPQLAGDTTAADRDRDQIAARAYELYLERGGSGGDAMDDWLAAEREFRAQQPRHR